MILGSFQSNSAVRKKRETTDGRTDGWTDGQRDKPAYRDARTHLKIDDDGKNLRFSPSLDQEGQRKLPLPRPFEDGQGVIATPSPEGWYSSNTLGPLGSARRLLPLDLAKDH